MLAAPASHKAQGRQHPAVTAVLDKPRAPISIAMRDFAFASAAIFKVRFRQFNKLLWQITAVLQLFACGPVLNSLDWIARR